MMWGATTSAAGVQMVSLPLASGVDPDRSRAPSAWGGVFDDVAPKNPAATLFSEADLDLTLSAAACVASGVEPGKRSSLQRFVPLGQGRPP